MSDSYEPEIVTPKESNWANPIAAFWYYCVSVVCFFTAGLLYVFCFIPEPDRSSYSDDTILELDSGLIALIFLILIIGLSCHFSHVYLKLKGTFKDKLDDE
jgi:hypothetical protein